MARIRRNFFPGNQMSDSLFTASFISASGGLQDAYTYISRGEVFANAQTGNIVLLAHNMAKGNIVTSIHYLAPLIFFALGVATSETISYTYKHNKAIHWRQIVVLVEIILLFIVGFMPGEWDLLANSLVSFSCAMQVQAFKKVNKQPYASTMCIGNLRSGTEAFCKFLQTKDKKILVKSMHYFLIIVIFAIGARIGSMFIPVLGMKTIWISCGLLLVAYLLMNKKHELS